MIALRATAVLLALMVVVLVPKLDVYPLWFELVAATLALCGAAVAIAVGWPPRPEPLIDGKWEPAPPDLDAIAGHADRLNPVPAVAPAPVDELLAIVPRPAVDPVAELRALVPAVAMLDGPPVDADQLELADRVRVLEQATVTLMARFDGYGEEMAQTMARLLASHREQTDKALTRFAEQLQAALPKPEASSDE